MEPAPLPEHQPMPQPPVPTKRTSKFKTLLSRTTAFTAEYSVFLIALGVALSNAAGLVYIFFGLVVDAMHGGAMSGWAQAPMFVLWLMVSSAVALPLAAVLWRRVQGELQQDAGSKGDLPKGAAKGFRTFWIILSVLGMLGMLMAAVYAPVSAALTSEPVLDMLLGVTLPSFIAVAISGIGVYIVTRTAGAQGITRWLLWGLVGLTIVLFAVNYLWASNLASAAPSRTAPTTRPTAPDYDIYDELYDDSYYDYTTPSQYR